MTSKMAALQGEAHFFEESMNPAKVKDYLSRPKEVDKLKGLKWLLAMVSKGRDVSDFFSDVVKNMAVRSVEVKKMVYIYLVHYADNDAQCRELALLSINSFQNDLRGSNQLIKALALRVMTSIRVPDIIQIQLLAVRECASDSSPYVRKCAANAIPKIFVLDPEQGPQLCQVMEKLLKDTNTMVLGSAVAAFSEVCPNKVELLHPAYRKLCHLLADVDEWGQIAILAALQRYVRTQFTDPQRHGSGDAALVGGGSNPAQDSNQPSKKVKRRIVKRGFYSSEEDASTEEEVDEIPAPSTTPEIGSVFTTSDADLGGDLDPDHRLLLRCSLPLLKSRNTGVVMAVCTTHYYCGSRTSSTMNQVAKAMLRILRNRREIQFVVLDAIRTLATENPAIFRPFLQEFFVKASDPLFTCNLKLDVLTMLATKENCSTILGELQTYVLHRDKSFVCAAVRAVGRVADARPEVAEQCLQGLLTLVTCSKTSVVVAEAVVVLRQLLQQNPDFKGSEAIVRRLAVLLVRSFTDDSHGDDKTRPNEHDQGGGTGGVAPTGSVVRATLAQPAARASIVWMLSEYHQHISGVASDVLRVLAKAFPELEEEVKMQVLNFAVKLALRSPEDQHVQSLASFVLEMARFDLSHDLRDRARFMTAMLGLATADEGVDEPALLALNAKADQVLLRRRMAPTSVGGNGVNPPPTPHLVLGTLSAVVGHPIKGYLPMPDWATVQPDGSAREPPKEEPRSLTGVYGDNDKSGKKSASGVGGDGNQLYSGRSSPESGSDSESDRNDTSSESSESGSYSSSEGSGSGSEGDASDFVSSSGDDDEDESGSSEGSGGSSAGSSIDDSDSSSPSSQGEEGVGLLIMGPGAASSAATYGASAPAPHSQDLTGLVERMSVVDREDSASPQLGARVEGLSLNSLSMAGVQGPRLVGAVGGGGISGTASAAQETIGLAGPPRVLGRSGSSTVSSSSAVDPGLDTSVSFPSTLLHHQAGGGLQVDYRYTRGRADVVSRPTTVLTMRLTLSNHRDNPIRRIRACPPRDATPMNAFPEVQELAAGATVDTHLGIDFGGRAKEVRFELKTDKGSFMVSVQPPPEELVFPQPISRPRFELVLGSIGQLEQKTVECLVPHEDIARIPARTLRSVNAAAIQQESKGQERYEWWFSACSLAGSMSERVFIKVSLIDGDSGKTTVDVFSDNPSMPSKLAGTVKAALEGRVR